MKRQTAWQAEKFWVQTINAVARCTLFLPDGKGHCQSGLQYGLVLAYSKCR